MTNILSISERIKYYNAPFVFTSIQNYLSGKYVKTFFILQAAGRSRSSNKNTILDVFKSSSKCYDNSIRARAIKDWSSMPKELTVFNIICNKFKSLIGNSLFKKRVRNERSRYNPS